MKFCLSTWNYLVNHEPETDLLAAAEEIIRDGFGLELFLAWDLEPAFFDRSNWPEICRSLGGRTRLTLHSAVTKTYSERAVREEIDLCRTLGAELLVVHPLSLGIQAGTLELSSSVELKQGDIKRIADIFEYAQQR